MSWIREFFNSFFISSDKTSHDSSHWPVNVRRSRTAANALMPSGRLLSAAAGIRSCNFWVASYQNSKKSAPVFWVLVQGFLDRRVKNFLNFPNEAYLSSADWRTELSSELSKFSSCLNSSAILKKKYILYFLKHFFRNMKLWKFIQQDQSTKDSLPPHSGLQKYIHRSFSTSSSSLQ